MEPIGYYYLGVGNMKNTCVIALDPHGNQDLGLSELYYGAKDGIYFYLVHTTRDAIPFDMEDLGNRFHNLHGDDEWGTDEEYCQTFEAMLTEVGIEYYRLPDKCFQIFSTLY